MQQQLRLAVDFFCIIDAILNYFNSMRFPFLLAGYLFCSSFTFAQTMDDAYITDHLVWFGVDFSKVKICGESIQDPDKVINLYFAKWNTNIIDFIENRYQGEIDGKKLIYDANMAVERSRSVAPSDIICYEKQAQILQNNEIQSIVDLCNSPKNDHGVGIILVANYFTKYGADRASYTVVYFDIESKKIMQTKEYIGDGSGFGLLAFWDKPLFYAAERLNTDFHTSFVKYRFDQRKIARQQKRQAKSQ